MHHIKKCDNGKYYTCGMPDGDNPSSTTIYNNEYLNVIAYTRNVEDSNGISDIISLVMLITDLDFSQSIKWICEQLHINNSYSHLCSHSSNNFPSIIFIEKVKKTKMNWELNNPTIYDYYDVYNPKLPYSKPFLKDNISVKTQKLFDISATFILKQLCFL